MQKLKEKIAAVKQWASTPRMKKRIDIALVCLFVGWAIYRFVAVGMQNRLDVYNPSRAAEKDGVPVSVIEMKAESGVIYEPLTVKNNRAYVSGARAKLLRPGMRVADGEIVSVSSNIDLDTGMYVVRTRGVHDGQHSAQFRATGYFVPVSAINNGAVYIVRDGMSQMAQITVARQDMNNAYITSGLKNGDMVIVSHIADAVRVKVMK